MSDPIDQEAIKQLYQRLITNKDKPIDDENIRKDIEESRKFQRDYYDNEFYKKEIDSIKSTMPSNIIDDTVGSYLYGCFQPELVIDIACTPACSSGLKNPELAPCDVASYEKKQGILTKLNSNKTENADIFITGNERITNEDRQQLQKDGVKIITTFTQDGESIDYILGESINLEAVDDVPQPADTNPTTYGWGWIIFIIAIIIIVILAVVLFNSK